MNKIYFPLLAVLSLTALPASAAPAKKELKLVPPTTFCASTQQIFQQVAGCEQNGLFVQAARNCLSDIDVQAKKIGLDMKGAFSLDKKKAQAVDLKQTAREYFEMTRKLDYVINVTELARVATYDYAEHLVLPEDEDEGGGETECFDGANRELESIAAQMDKKQRDFETALELTKKNLMGAQSGETDLGSLGNEPAPKAAPAGGPAGPRVKNWRGSDISGTEQKKK